MNTVQLQAPPDLLLRRRVASLRRLTPAALAAIPPLDPVTDIHVQGEVLGPRLGEELRLVTAGYLGECRRLHDGRRQIVRLRLPGDLVRLQRQEPGWTLEALTRARTVSAERLRTPGAGLEAICAALEEAGQAQMLHQLVRLGRLSAYERTAHLLLELHRRLQAVGLAAAGGLHLPLTQETLADCLGLSVVHVNRVLQQLRRNGLLTYRSGQMTFPNPAGLAAAAALAPREAAKAEVARLQAV